MQSLSGNSGVATAAAGKSAAHNNMQPHGVVAFYIKAIKTRGPAVSAHTFADASAGYYRSHDEHTIEASPRKGFLNAAKTIPECVAGAIAEVNKSKQQLKTTLQTLRHNASDIAANYSTKIELIGVKKQLDAEVNVAVQAVPVGTILPMASLSTSAATSFVLCDGRQLSRATYSSLFRHIGDTWGGGDGSTTFNVPDLRGRTLVGVDDHHAIGLRAGEEVHLLTSEALPAHTHQYVEGGGLAGIPQYAAANTGSNPAWAGVTAALSHGSYTQTTHVNMQPFAVVQFYVKAVASTNASTSLDLLPSVVVI